MPNLLSKNDLRALRNALGGGQELVLERSMGDYKVRASTGPASPARGVDMLVRLEEWNRGTYSTQYLTGVDQVEEILRARHGGIR